jgi:hypothetical protein
MRARKLNGVAVVSDSQGVVVALYMNFDWIARAGHRIYDWACAQEPNLDVVL